MVTDTNCPRCENLARYLILPYWPSPFTKHGGLCSDCCVKANELYERSGWPPLDNNKDWARMPTDCPCGGLEEFCGVCDGTGIAWTDK